MNALVAAMTLWLSANFDLPIIRDLPRVEFVSASAMASLRYKDLSFNQAASDAASADTLAVYRDDTRTIYLREGWTGDSPAELSILLHELVHHVQNVGMFKFECPQEREQLAYKAQDRWLSLFGRNLQSEFGLDSLSLLVKSKCFF
jgi:uncharacterized protein DUF6647